MPSCPICSANVSPWDPQACATHGQSAHPFASTPSFTAPSGTVTTFANDNDIAQFIFNNPLTVNVAPPPAAIQAVALSAAAADGILMTNAKTVSPHVSGSGVCTAATVVALWEAARLCTDSPHYEVDKTALFVSMAYTFVTLDATEEHDTLGSIELVPALTATNAPNTPAWTTYATLHTKWLEVLSKRTIPGEVTFRQLARRWAPQIFQLVHENDEFKELAVTGTPLTWKTTVKSQHYYALLSFFPAMKAPPSWTTEEKDAHELHVAFVGKSGSSRQSSAKPARAGLGTGYQTVPLSSAQAANMSTPPPIYGGTPVKVNADGSTSARRPLPAYLTNSGFVMPPGWGSP